MRVRRRLTLTARTSQPSLFYVLPHIDSSGTLTFTPAHDAVGTAEVIVTARDDGGTRNGGLDTRTASFRIVIVPRNQPPSMHGGGPVSVIENAGPQSLPWATSIRPGPANESSQTVRFTTTTDSPELFAAQPTLKPNGTLTFTPATNATGSAWVNVTERDSGGTAHGGLDSYGVSFKLTIRAVNQPPSFTGAGDVSVWENSGPQNGQWIVSSSAGPPAESKQHVSYTVTSDDPGLFTSGGQPALSDAGLLTFTPASDASGSAHVTVVAHDDGGMADGGVDTSQAQTFTVTVMRVNRVPFFTKGSDVTVAENSGAASIRGWATGIGAGKGDTGQTLSFQIVGDTNSALFASGPAIDPASGDLSFTPATNANGTATLAVQLHDNGGTGHGGIDTSAVQHFVVTVTPVNQAPTFTAGGPVTVDQDVGAVTVHQWATGINPGAPNEASQPLTFVLTDDSPGLFSTAPSVDSNTGDLSFTTAPHAHGTAHLTVTLDDQSGGTHTSAAAPLTITINAPAPVVPATKPVVPVNQPPSFTPGANLTVATSAGAQVQSWATNISAGAPSEAGQPLTFIVSETNASLFSVPPSISANGTLSYTPAVGVHGVSTVSVQLDDGQTVNHASPTSTFTITVFAPPTAVDDSAAHRPPGATSSATRSQTTPTRRAQRSRSARRSCRTRRTAP